jgi:hypothetical protein
MKAFLGKSVYADTSNMTDRLHWKPRPIEETILDTAAAL